MRRALSLFLLLSISLGFAGQTAPLSPDERAIMASVGKLRSVPDADRPAATRDLALRIRKLPAGDRKVSIANGLANLSTEGDFGQDTLQEVADTLADALRVTPQPRRNDAVDGAYQELAQLERFEHVRVTLDDPSFAAARAQLDEMQADRERADFTLSDIDGRSWTLSALKGKVVVVNFWATWCPPCRKEMPDLQRLYDEFKDRGLVILAISDEKPETVKPFIAKAGYTFPVLLDPGRVVNDRYHMTGIPNSYVYDRRGKLVAQSIDMRTRRQFLAMLAKAGLRP